MRKDGSMGEDDRWVVSAETNSEGSSYGVKISEMVSVVEAGLGTVWCWVSFNVA